MSPEDKIESIVWLNVRFCLTFLLAARKVAGDDLISALLLGCVVGANLDHLDQRPGDTRRFGALGSPADEDRRPVNSKSLSDSLGVPRETVRTKINVLVDAGVLRRVDRGVILPGSTVSSPAVAVMSLACLKALEDLVAGLRCVEACGIDRDHHLAQPVWPMAGAVVRLGAGHVIRGITYARSLPEDLGVTAAFILLAVGHLTAGTPKGTSDDGEVPASLTTAAGMVRGSTVASFLGMPDATVRRHLHALVDHDRLTLSGHGYDLIRNREHQYPGREFQHRMVAATAQFMWRLRQCGVVTSRTDTLTS